MTGAGPDLFNGSNYGDTPYIENVWVILCLFAISLVGQSTAISLILALVNDLLRASQNAAKAVALVTVGAIALELPPTSGFAPDRAAKMVQNSGK